MGLNIKNEETCRLAAEFTREKHRRNADALARELHAIGRRCAGLVGPGTSAAEHGDALYDERGLPI